VKEDVSCTIVSTVGMSRPLPYPLPTTPFTSPTPSHRPNDALQKAGIRMCESEISALQQARDPHIVQLVEVFETPEVGKTTHRPLYRLRQPTPPLLF
jgi:hypothetical protein